MWGGKYKKMEFSMLKYLYYEVMENSWVCRLLLLSCDNRTLLLTFMALISSITFCCALSLNATGGTFISIFEFNL